MRINANIAALNSARNLSNTQMQLGKSLEKLSSGYRINRAADDAAGLAISEGLRSEIRGSTPRPSATLRTASASCRRLKAALTEVHSMLQRMRELAVQAANGTSDGSAEQLRSRPAGDGDHRHRHPHHVLRHLGVRELRRVGCGTELPGRRERHGRPGRRSPTT